MSEDKNQKESTEMLDQISNQLDAEALQDQLSKTQEFADKNKNIIIGVLAAIILAVVAYSGYDWYVRDQNTEAELQLFPAVFYLEKDSVNKALYGDQNTTDGLIAVAEDYGMAPAGNLANLYVGIAFIKQEKFEDALSYLNNFSSNDFLLQARAYSLMGDANAELGNVGEAISNYKKAADYKPNAQFTPTYLVKLAAAYEKNGQIDEANQAYDKIINEYPLSSEINTAKVRRARNG